MLDDDDKELPYIVAAFFVSYLLEASTNENDETLRAAAQLIESLHLYGDNYVKELATIGYLEGIQNIWIYSNTDFYDYLLPESRKWWNQLLKFWGGKIRYVGETYFQEQ